MDIEKTVDESVDWIHLAQDSSSGRFLLIW
jgi:hypothetical protein